MKVRSVPRADLSRVSGEPWVDPAHRPCVIDGTAYVPVKNGFSFDREITAPPRYRGRGFFMIGDIAIVRGTAPAPDDLKKVVALRKPRGVLLVRAMDDITRVPDCEVLYGTVGEVLHRENGYTYLLDPSKVMFSQGNLPEKRRMASLIRPGERVADMFAGIGYFTIPMAGAGADVHAMEINPVAFSYLQRNLETNKLAGRVSASPGDCRDLLSGTYDRIVMGHFDAVTMLPDALAHAAPGTVIHLHSLGSVEVEIRSAVSGAGFSAALDVHKVKKYAPHTWHIVQDIVIQ